MKIHRLLRQCIQENGSVDEIIPPELWCLAQCRALKNQQNLGKEGGIRAFCRWNYMRKKNTQHEKPRIILII